MSKGYCKLSIEDREQIDNAIEQNRSIAITELTKLFPHSYNTVIRYINANYERKLYKKKEPTVSNRLSNETILEILLKINRGRENHRKWEEIATDLDWTENKTKLFWGRNKSKLLNHYRSNSSNLYTTSGDT